MVTCQSANQLKTPAKVSWAFKMVSQFGSLGYTIMGKTADLTVVQKTIIDTLHKEGKPQTFIAKEAGCSQSAVSKHVNRTLSGRKKCVYIYIYIYIYCTYIHTHTQIWSSTAVIHIYNKKCFWKFSFAITGINYFLKQNFFFDQIKGRLVEHKRLKHSKILQTPNLCLAFHLNIMILFFHNCDFFLHIFLTIFDLHLALQEKSVKKWAQCIVNMKKFLYWFFPYWVLIFQRFTHILNRVVL